MTARGLIIGAPASNSGKTVVTLALLRALTRAGRRVSSFKVGPDYIDPAFHAAASGRVCYNLDLWAMRPATSAALMARLQEDSELVIGEGAMGLFDGANESSGSTADVAAWTGWPVLLVVDVRGQAASAAALVRGFIQHRADVPIAGLIFNRTGGGSHERILRKSVEPLGVPVLGCLPRDPALVLPERHLGLVQAGERGDLDGFLERAADTIEEQVDFHALQGLARPARPIGTTDDKTGLAPLGQRIAVARDVAFAFTYPALLEGWRKAGAELTFFSPLADEAPSTDATAVYLPGGYPELHVARLAANGNFMAGLRSAVQRDAVVHGECGGYMVLGQGLVDGAEQRHAMAGLLALETSFARRRLHLGYRRATLISDCGLGKRGAGFTGHEFHYATILDEGPGEALFTCRDARGESLGPAGRRNGRVFGSFVHLIDAAAESRPEVAA